ncbi:MAG TPA: hypothetical protein VMV10_26635 [Pirellulales bacterium]|nr:hypothetical protein [Pirellulales bacterium]
MKIAWLLRGWIGVVSLSICLPCRAADEHSADAGPFVRALWAVQLFGTDAAADPRNDERTKLSLASSLAKNGAITKKAVENQLMDAKTFDRFAGDGPGIDFERVRDAIGKEIPASRRRLFPKLAAHLDELTTSFDRIDPSHLKAGEQLADWIAAHYETGKELPLVFVCTGNSRRSILGATMASAAAAYWGLPEIRGYSGGTEPSAFNPRSVAALRAIGIEIEPTGKEAPRGAEQAPNPIYAVRWGEASDAGQPGMETLEFSKHYSDFHNPKSGFAALMVCTHADRNCPIVEGASRRISMPYLDPKAYDGGEYESAKYAERRDDMGRLMLAVMLKARRKLCQEGKLN